MITSAWTPVSARAFAAVKLSATIVPQAMIVRSVPSRRIFAFPTWNGLPGSVIVGTFSRPNRMYTGPFIWAASITALYVSW